MIDYSLCSSQNCKIKASCQRSIDNHIGEKLTMISIANFLHSDNCCNHFKPITDNPVPNTDNISLLEISKQASDIAISVTNMVEFIQVKVLVGSLIISPKQIEALKKYGIDLTILINKI